MNKPDENALAERIQSLTPAQRAEVEDFVDFLASKQQRQLAGETLRAMWAQAPGEELTPEIEQRIVEEVRAVRAERRARRDTERADRS